MRDLSQLERFLEGRCSLATTYARLLICQHRSSRGRIQESTGGLVLASAEGTRGDRAREISSVKVCWFDDTGRGACRVPQSWRVLYRDDGGEFKPAKNRGSYRTEKDRFNAVGIDPAIKLEIVLEDRWSAGIQQVVID